MSVGSAGNEQVWFLDTLVEVRVAASAGSDGISVLEHRARQGDSPPLHVHRTEDEIFHVLEGEFRFLVSGEEHRLRAGETLLAAKGLPHTYRVDSVEGGRWLTVTRGGDFERLVRSFSRPAERPELPPPSGPPTPEQLEALMAACRECGIEIVGPPLH